MFILWRLYLQTKRCLINHALNIIFLYVKNSHMLPLSTIKKDTVKDTFLTYHQETNFYELVWGYYQMSRKILEFGDFDKLNIDYLSVSYTMTRFLTGHKFCRFLFICLVDKQFVKLNFIYLECIFLKKYCNL